MNDESKLSGEWPRITFGMIVLNGEPYIRYNLRSLYPHAHQIIVVEGAAPAGVGVATPDGHSQDTTLQTVRRFIEEEDPDNKMILVTAEDEGHPNGFWPGEKDEQSQAYAKRATGDYLWQIDCDEFYLSQAMQKMLKFLADHPETTAVTFHQRAFWGDVDIEVDSHHLHLGGADFHRLFKWGPGYTYTTHRPPTVVDDLGRDTRDLVYIGPQEAKNMGVELLHYSLLLPKQVREKCNYYAAADWAHSPAAARWAEENYMKIGSPWRVYNVYRHLSWLQRYSKDVPEGVQQMMADIRAGKIDIELRDNEDARKLLRSPIYRFKRFFVKHSLSASQATDRFIAALPQPLHRVAKFMYSRIIARLGIKPA